jgi:hypothetical protein
MGCAAAAKKNQRNVRASNKKPSLRMEISARRASIFTTI